MHFHWRQNMGNTSIIGLLILIADFFAIYKIINSSVATGMKVLWIVVVFLLPIIGLIAWFLAGPGDKSLKL